MAKKTKAESKTLVDMVHEWILARWNFRNAHGDRLQEALVELVRTEENMRESVVGERELGKAALILGAGLPESPKPKRKRRGEKSLSEL